MILYSIIYKGDYVDDTHVIGIADSIDSAIKLINEHIEDHVDEQQPTLHKRTFENNDYVEFYIDKDDGFYGVTQHKLNKY